MPSTLPKFEIPVPIDGVHNELPISAVPPTALYYSQNFLVRRFIRSSGTGSAALTTRPGLNSMNSTPDVTSATNGFPNSAAFYRHNSLEGGGPATDGRKRLVFGCTKRWVIKSAQNATKYYTIVPPGNYTGTLTDLWVLKSFEKANTVYLMGVNGVDVPQKWDGLMGAAGPTNAATAFGASAPVAKCMMVLAGRVLLANLRSGATQGPEMVTYGSVNDMDAGWATFFINCADTGGEIIAAEEMGNLRGYLYKTDSIYGVTAQAATDPFSFQLLSRNTPGPHSSRCVVTIPDGRHVYFARDWTVRVWDGQQSQPLGGNGADGKSGNPFQRFVENNYNPGVAALDSAWGTYFPQMNEVWFVFGFSSGTSPLHGVAFNLDSGAFWPLSFASYITYGGLTAGVFCPIPGNQNIVERLAFGLGAATDDRDLFGASGEGWTTVPQGYDQTFAGGQADILATADTGLFDAGDPTAFKTLLETDHRLAVAPASPTNVGVQVLTANYDQVPAVGALASFPTTAGGPFTLGHRSNARLMGLRFRHDRSTNGLVWRGCTASFATRGRR